MWARDSNKKYCALSPSSLTAIDVSSEGLRQARNAVPRARFVLMDAQQLEFASDTFDVVCGMAILHHLDLHRAIPKLARVLRPGGVGLFMEALGHNPLINAYRRLTPEVRGGDAAPSGQGHAVPSRIAVVGLEGRLHPTEQVAGKT